jgi:hypothetical protein
MPPKAIVLSPIVLQALFCLPLFPQVQHKATRPVDVPATAAPASSSTAFELLKSFRGDWTILANGKPLSFPMHYAFASKDTVITEQFGKELSVFSHDGPTCS